MLFKQLTDWDTEKETYIEKGKEFAYGNSTF